MRDDTPEIETYSLVQDYLLIPRGFSYVILTVFPGLAGVSRLIFPCQMVEGQEIEPLSISSIYGSEMQTKDVQKVDVRCITLSFVHSGSVENALTG